MESNNENQNEDVKTAYSDDLPPPIEAYNYAGFWMRFWAYLIDVIVVFSINGILLSPLKFANEGLPIEISFWTLNGILAGIIYYVYFLLMTRYFQQTIGKIDRKSTRLNSSHVAISYAVFCLKKKI